MFKCSECGHIQKEENKFHCVKCNGWKINWVVINDNINNLNETLRDISTLGSGVSVDFKDRLYSDLFDVPKIPRRDS